MIYPEAHQNTCYKHNALWLCFNTDHRLIRSIMRLTVIPSIPIQIQSMIFTHMNTTKSCQRSGYDIILNSSKIYSNFRKPSALLIMRCSSKVQTSIKNSKLIGQLYTCNIKMKIDIHNYHKSRKCGFNGVILCSKSCFTRFFERKAAIGLKCAHVLDSYHL